MNHIGPPYYDTRKLPPDFQAATLHCDFLFILVLALLVCNAAAGFTSRLAGGLAFAAAAFFCTFAQIAGLNGFNSFHNLRLHSVQSIVSSQTETDMSCIKDSISNIIFKVNHICSIYIFPRSARDFTPCLQKNAAQFLRRIRAI